MFQSISTVSIIVSDQDKAKDFYVNKLGFHLRSDTPMWPGAPSRWLTVVPTEDSATEILLDVIIPGSEHFASLIGNSQGVFFYVSGIEELVEKMKANGVEFEGQVESQPFGKMIQVKDQDNNKLLLVEPPAPQG